MSPVDQDPGDEPQHQPATPGATLTALWAGLRLVVLDVETLQGPDGHRVIEVVKRGEEPLLLAFEEGLVRAQFEHGGHEVFLAGTLLEPADEVRDRHVELLGVHHGGIEK